MEKKNSKMSFAKGHALGNDYAVVEADAAPASPESWAREFCDRHRGVGSDGVLVVERRGGTEPVGLSIVNPDGSRAEKSGNGLRILAAYLHEAGAVGGEPFRVRLPGDTVTLCVEDVLPDGVRMVRAEMGRASFAPEDVGLNPANAYHDSAQESDGATENAPSKVGTVALPLDSGASIQIQPVSLGNPHCVVFVDALDRGMFLARGPELATHPAFSAGTNVQFARALGPDSLEAWVWERGAGETLASGSSSCAVAAAAIRQERVSERSLEVHMPGGVLGVDVGDDFACTLRGPARIIYTGEIPVSVLADWARG